MATKSTQTFNPYSVIIDMTSTPNFYLCQSSNKYDWYGLVVTGDNAAICSCKAAQEGLNCRHRKSVLARFFYHEQAPEPTEAAWTAIEEAAETAQMIEEVERMLEADRLAVFGI